MTRMPGTKTLNAPPGGKPGILAMLVSSGPNSSRYEDRLDDPHDHPDGVSQAQRQRSLEDEPGVAKDSHRSVSPWRVRRRVSRSDRPVFLRKTSSRLGRWRSIVGRRQAVAVEQAQDVRHRLLAPDPRRDGPGRPRCPASRTNGWPAQQRRRPRSPWPLTPIVRTSPAISCFSSSGEPSATIRPWSMIARRSHRASASSR